VCGGGIERASVFRGQDADHRRDDRVRAHRFEPVDEVAALILGPRHEDPFSKQRPRIEPAQVLAQRDDASHDGDRRPAIGPLPGDLRHLPQCAGDRLLCRTGAVVDHRRRIVRRSSVCEQRVQHVRQLLRAGVADERAVDPCEARPIDRRRRLASVLVAADESHGVAAARVGDRNAGVSGHRNAGGNTGDHLERDALFVEEERFGAAAAEHVRIAPFQPCDGFSLARLFREEITDRLLFQWLRSGGAHIDLLCIRTRGTQQSRRHQMVVEHDIGGGQVVHAANGDQARIAGAGAD
jgi:hypothetical protein